MQIIEIYSNLVRKNHLIIILLRISLPGKQVFFISILQRCRTGNTRTEFQYISISTLQLVGIARYIRPRADETHIAYQDIPKFG